MFSHPFNPNSAITFVPLSDRVGMRRAQLGLGRIPPGRESFVPYSHAAQEEFVFILSGAGEMEIDGERFAVGPGDYVGFPTDGAVHQLYNTGAQELVYLMGGERTDSDMTHFPSLKKIGIWAEGKMRYVDTENAQQFLPDDFVRRSGA
ncbi:MAG: cupin domain-containing protein [Parvibaculum sp.]